MARAIGNDGRWKEWGELTAEERAAWQEAMAMAEAAVCDRKRGEAAPTLAQNITRYEQKKRFLY